MSLNQKAMLARVSISQWTARKHDKTISIKVSTEHGAAANAGRYNKLLVAETAIKEIGAAANAARTFHYDNTLPWSDDGARILPAANFMAYTAQMSKYRAAFETAVNDFQANYPTYVESAKIRLNGMFRADDYPDVSDLARRYSFGIAIDPLPDAADFRVDLANGEADNIRQQIETRVNAAHAAAMRDLWKRVFDVCYHAADRLGSKDAIFRDSLINNAVELVELLPRLNITEDAELESARREVETALCGYAPESLRKNPADRMRAANAAASIAAAVKSKAIA